MWTIYVFSFQIFIVRFQFPKHKESRRLETGCRPLTRAVWHESPPLLSSQSTSWLRYTFVPRSTPLWEAVQPTWSHLHQQWITLAGKQGCASLMKILTKKNSYGKILLPNSGLKKSGVLLYHQTSGLIWEEIRSINVSPLPPLNHRQSMLHSTCTSLAAL